MFKPEELCCESGSGSIHVDFARLDPDPYCECGPRSKSKVIDQNEQIYLNLGFQKDVCLTTYYINEVPVYFACKN